MHFDPASVPPVLVGLGVGGLAFDAAYRVHARAAEESAWERCGREPDRAAYGYYLDWAESLDPSVVSARWGDPDRLEAEYRAWSDAPVSPDYQAKEDAMIAKSMAYTRWQLARGSRNGVVLAEARYAAGAPAAGADPEAVRGMQDLLGWLRDRDPELARLGVGFLPVEGLEGGPIEKAMAAVTGSEHVHPLAPSFSAAANGARHQRMVESLSSGLRWAVGDLFALAEAEAESEPAPGAVGPRFTVHNAVRGTSTPYTMKSEDELPAAARCRPPISRSTAPPRAPRPWPGRSTTAWQRPPSPTWRARCPGPWGSRPRSS